MSTFAGVLPRETWRRAFLLAALVGIGLFAGGVSAGSAEGTHRQGVAKGKPDAPQTVDASIYLTPSTTLAGNCTAPTNGGVVTGTGCTFALDIMVNAGSNAAPDGLTAQQSYLTFTSQLISVTRKFPSDPLVTCVVTNIVVTDLTVWDAALQNEVCNNQPGGCVFRGALVGNGSIGYASGALSNCPNGCPDPAQPPPQNQPIFKVGSIPICAKAPGAVTIHWQFYDPSCSAPYPPAPATRDTELVTLSGNIASLCTLFADYHFTIPQPTSTPTATPTPIPTCGTGSDYVISQSSGVSIVPGTTLITGTQCDDCVTSISLPFTYDFYGIPFDSADLGANGNIQFTTSSFAYTAGCLPYPPFDYSILPYWEDLDASPGITSDLGVLGVYSSVTGAAPNRVFNLEWRACQNNGGFSCGRGVNFEVRLFEGQDRFDIVYGELRDNGDLATIGVQRHTGQSPFGSFTQFSCQGGGIVQGLQLSFAPPSFCPTDTPSPTSTPTNTRTVTNTSTLTYTPTQTPTPTLTYTPTQTPTPTSTYTPTLTPTPTPTPLLIGHVTWQGRAAQPSALQQLPVTLTLKLGTTEVNYPSQNTDASGYFTVPVTALSGGTYNWRIKGPKFLASAGTLTLAGARRTNVEMGLVRTGDCNNDNTVNINDFSIIKNSFGKTIGDPGYDDRGDLTGDRTVTILDLNWVRSNFGFVGPPPIGIGR